MPTRIVDDRVLLPGLDQRYRDGMKLFEPIPPAAAGNAAHFYRWSGDNEILGRCVHVGTRVDTQEKYHWAVRSSPAARGLEVHDFWSRELWTTARYREEQPAAQPRGSAGGIGGLEIV